MTSNRQIEEARAEVGVISVFTLVLWLCCLTAGVVGLLVPYPRPRPAVEVPPVEAQIMNVRIAPQALATPRVGMSSSPPPPDLLAPDQPPPPPTMAAMESPPAMAVTLPAPTIGFAKPIAAPAPIVAAMQAVSTSPAANPAPQAVRQITFGEGEGQQPAPQYPREAVLADQQGTVVVRFTVAPDGSVISAEAKVPCPFPLLNQAAVRAVRETWRFQSGPARIYEVSIHFELTD